MDAPVAVVLAAGKSTRMKSVVPKVLHEVCGRPLIDYVLSAARTAGAGRIIVIVGHGADQVRGCLADQPDVEFAVQSEQKGTGHAVMMCAEQLQSHRGPVLVLTGDAPLMQAASFTTLLEAFQSHGAGCVIGTAKTPKNFGLGRIVRNADGEFLKIVEQKDASPEEQAIQEINVGCYVFDSQPLFDALTQIRPNNKQGELYLTDCAAVLKQRGFPVVASCSMDIAEALGVNTRAELAEVQQAVQQRIFQRLYAEGVTIVAPGQTTIEDQVQIGNDTVIFPFTMIERGAVIGPDCRIGPHALIKGNARLTSGTIVPPGTGLTHTGPVGH